MTTLVDVGASRGTVGKPLRDRGYTGRIVSFEPVAGTYGHLERAASGDPTWSTHRLALGDTAGQFTINVAASDDLSSFLKPSALGRKLTCQVSAPEVIDVERLDNVYASLVGTPAILKVDTQGFEMAVIAGASGVLEQILGIQLELPIRACYDGSPDLVDSLVELRALGYEIVDMRPVIAYGLDLSRAAEVDCLLVRSGARKRNASADSGKLTGCGPLGVRSWRTARATTARRRPYADSSLHEPTEAGARRTDRVRFP